MPDDPKETKKTERQDPGDEGLTSLFKSFEQLARIYGERAADLALEQDSVPLVNHYSDVITEQIRQLGGTLRTAYRASGAETRQQVNDLLQMTAANSLASGAREAISAVRTPSSLALATNPLLLIKKIIRLLAKALGISLPKLVDALLELIDELFGGQAEATSRAAAEQVHRGEIRFLEAQLHLEKLTQIQERARRETDENDH